MSGATFTIRSQLSIHKPPNRNSEADLQFIEHPAIEEFLNWQQLQYNVVKHSSDC